MLLRLVELAGGRIERQRLMELAFRHSVECRSSSSHHRYHFVQCHHGRDSFLLTRDWSLLSKLGLALEHDSQHFSLTKEGREYASNIDEGEMQLVDNLHSDCSLMSTNSIAPNVDDRNGWYASNSEREIVRNGHVADDPLKSFYSVGYQSLTIDAFLNLLMQCGVQNLVDTRFTPTSRVYGFHTSTLARLCEEVGIRYTLEKSLGVPRSQRPARLAEGEGRRFKQTYAEIMQQAHQAVMRVAHLAQSETTAIMCYEAEVGNCHRGLLRSRLEDLTGLASKELRHGRVV